jgi:hypothetical protein
MFLAPLQMHNSSFKVLAEVKDLAEQWSTSTQDLGEFLSNKETINNIKVGGRSVQQYTV